MLLLIILGGYLYKRGKTREAVVHESTVISRSTVKKNVKYAMTYDDARGKANKRNKRTRENSMLMTGT
jgi:hypothetical protein